MLTVTQTDYEAPGHAEAIIELMDSYASDITGGGAPLSTFAKQNLPTELKKRSNVVTVLAFSADVPAGLIIAIEGFSTFACQPLLNLHDVVVAEKFRRQGIAKRMLAKMEEIARETGCCKLTLEILENNRNAMALYQKIGFKPYELDPQMGRALFLEKKF
jgi:ribosomal protein S18 acetylase RimI-like enzyme